MKPKQNIPLIAIALWLPVPVNGLINGFYLKGLTNSLLFWAVDFITNFLLPLGILFALKIYTNLSPSDYGLGIKQFRTKRLQLLGDSFVCTFWFLITGIGLYRVLWIFLWSFENSVDMFSYKSTLPDGLGRVILGSWFAISAGFGEEVFYRGILKELIYRSVRPQFKYAPWIFIGTSALLFGFSHWEGGVTQVTCTLILGGIAAKLYLWCRSLWPLIIAHATTTFLSYAV